MIETTFSPAILFIFGCTQWCIFVRNHTRKKRIRYHRAKVSVTHIEHGIKEANDLGIDVTTDVNDINFVSGKSILIINIHNNHH